MESSSFKYHVYLSSTGDDTCRRFMNQLQEALRRKKINFIVDQLGPLTAIEESRISIVVFTEHYFISTWCLEVLVRILQCRQMLGQIVVPVFYGVEPWNVRNQAGPVRVAFASLIEFYGENSKKLQRWRAALNAAANLPWWVSGINRPDYVILEDIFHDVLKGIYNLSASDDEGFVRIDSKVEQIESLLQIGREDVCGTVGIGKSSSSPQFKYDVYLSFRGGDARYSIANNLYAALSMKNIRTFIDDKDLAIGAQIGPSLLEAIEASRVTIIVFSKNYVTSRWRLDELVKIQECRKTNGQIVIPIFYDIDPSSVWRQIGMFESAFAKHEKVLKQNLGKLQRWRDALTDAASISGWVSNFRSGPQLIENIVNDILKRIANMSPTDNGSFGRKISKVKQIESLLQFGREDVRKIGIGKSLIPSTTSLSITHHFKYNVFLSFRGEDTRYNFMSHLVGVLQRKKVITFTDYKLTRGCKISLSLWKAIEELKIAIVIFSKNYASSTWCLKELVKIIKCRKKYGQIVMPVFCGIDPSNVRKQRGTFCKAFAKHERVFGKKSNKVTRWRAALTEAANLSGWDSSVIRIEYILVQRIAKNISMTLESTSSIEMGSQSLWGWSNDVQALGIWGISGTGKTTLAHVVFNKISYMFEGSYFIYDIRKKSHKSDELNRLRQQLLSTILENESTNIGIYVEGDTFTWNKHGCKKFLIVFDDVSDFRQIESLLGGLDCFGPQSRIIVTTRDETVLKNCRVDKIYNVNELLCDQVRKPFSWYGFG